MRQQSVCRFPQTKRVYSTCGQNYNGSDKFKQKNKPSAVIIFCMIVFRLCESAVWFISICSRIWLTAAKMREMNWWCCQVTLNVLSREPRSSRVGELGPTGQAEVNPPGAQNHPLRCAIFRLRVVGHARNFLSLKVFWVQESVTWFVSRLQVSHEAVERHAR